jgi:hypothetical protein
VTDLPARSVTLSLPFPYRELHPNDRPHFHKKAAAVRTYRMEAKVEAKRVMGTTYRPGEYPLRTPVQAQVTFTVTDERQRDEDGLMASLKPMWDGFVDARLLLEDHNKVLHIGAPLIVHGDKAGVVVVLTEPGMALHLETVAEWAL